jgi:Ser/Thr protein kinase RdoA (MazF antagonist)
MDDLSGLERAFFGAVGAAEINAWLADTLRERLAVDVSEILFRAGRIDAVYGLLLADGRKVVLKVHRPPVDVSGLEAQREALAYLASTGYPAPEPVDGPVTRGGHVVTIETLLEQGTSADARVPGVRRALAAALVDHIRLLRDVDHLRTRLPPGPAWTRYRDGPWPAPHDPIFDFTTTPEPWSWLDAFAREAAGELVALRGQDPLVIGHGDWYDGNARVDGERIVAVFDWDLMAETEAVLAGLAATAYLAAAAPSPSQATAFLGDVEDARGAAFTATQRRAASAAGRWVLAFNARCQLSNLGNRAQIDDDEIPATSPLGRLLRGRDAYQSLW